ncbi:dihydropteroate synthase [Helicobacter mustelae]|uniref:dihydropteroate synthase n=1 Tax=Helicobacter mustelae (strain ATCC 43772 / CCUG 25715 / CIP 103759 / LMG 18044 / NCTC 12198 / R85-136P) TaxID=679897 RepID=D3UFY9_HELM1|nr:dihydropteroate synthase [Helicobacter mustelae]CBG39410.1 putative dihydropteroate synthase [Helicobacter mustelae 12198]SQH70923.1 dihydropteroate synthase [Helicobacter mustelae]
MTQIKTLNPDFLPQAFARIGSDAMGCAIMGKKSQILAFEITHLSLSATLILKQEAIGVGGDFATPRDCILARDAFYDGVLFGTKAQLQRLLNKLKTQPFGLGDLAKRLKAHLSQRKDFGTQIMAVINLTPDSFFVDSRSNALDAKQKILSLLEMEVGMIDIGGASSRPGSQILEAEEELLRLREVFDFIASQKLYLQKKFSIDTYNVEVAKAALDSGFAILNDVSGFQNPGMLELAASYKATVILMHTRGSPKEMQNLTNYEHLFGEMSAFFAEKITALKNMGVYDIILDIGFGFAKNLEQNLDLIAHLRHFESFGLPLLVGASRKSTIQKILNKTPEDSLSGTLAMHFLALLNGANILRVHDPLEHLDLLKIYQAYQHQQGETCISPL